MYTGGQEKVKLIFKRTGLDHMTFFNPSNLVDGNYSTIHQTNPADFVYFSMSGYVFFSLQKFVSYMP